MDVDNATPSSATSEAALSAAESLADVVFPQPAQVQGGSITWCLKSYVLESVKKMLSLRHCAAGPRRWALNLYPTGCPSCTQPGKQMSLIVAVEEADNMTPFSEEWEITLAVLSPDGSAFVTKTTSHSFTPEARDWGFPSMLPCSRISEALAADGSLTVKAELRFKEMVSVKVSVPLELAADVLARVLQRHHANLRAFLNVRAPALAFTAISELLPAALPASATFQRFLASWQQAEDKSIILAFHGTPEENVESISISGLDPARRGSANGQLLGFGEYFGRSFADSIPYCNGGRRVLVMACSTDAAAVRHSSTGILVLHRAESHLPLATLAV